MTLARTSFQRRYWSPNQLPTNQIDGEGHEIFINTSFATNSKEYTLRSMDCDGYPIVRTNSSNQHMKAPPNENPDK